VATSKFIVIKSNLGILQTTWR